MLPLVKEERRRKRKRRFRSYLNQRRKALREPDLQARGLGDMVFFFVNVVYGNWVVEEVFGYQLFDSPHHIKMPPLSDSMAME